MKKLIPLVIYPNGVRTTVGFATVEEDGSIRIVLNEGFRTGLPENLEGGEFSFSFYPPYRDRNEEQEEVSGYGPVILDKDGNPITEDKDSSGE